MQVKIKDKFYSSADEPILIILSDSDIENIKNMIGYKYCSYPVGKYHPDEIKEFMSSE